MMIVFYYENTLFYYIKKQGAWITETNLVNRFSSSVSLIYLMNTSENFWFSDVFRGYRSETFVENGLTNLFL